MGKQLGCTHHISEDLVNGARVSRIVYDMTGFMKQCVDAYLSLAGGNVKKLRVVNTPFLSDADSCLLYTSDAADE